MSECVIDPILSKIVLSLAPLVSTLLQPSITLILSLVLHLVQRGYLPEPIPLWIEALAFSLQKAESVGIELSSLLSLVLVLLRMLDFIILTVFL